MPPLDFYMSRLPLEGRTIQNAIRKQEAAGDLLLEGTCRRIERFEIIMGLHGDAKEDEEPSMPPIHREKQKRLWMQTQGRYR